MKRSLALTTVAALAVLGLTGLRCSSGWRRLGWRPVGTPSGTQSFGDPPTVAVDVCSLLPVAKMVALTGKPFTLAKNFDDPGYACTYNVEGSKGWFWEVEINDVGSKTSVGPDILIGADGGLKSLSGIAYPAIAATDGASLQWGDDEVTVSDESTYSYARGTTSQYVAVAEALMAAIDQSRSN
jgi:hypothetical protein